MCCCANFTLQNSSMADHKFTIERLTDKNWQAWKFQITLLLKSKQLWDVVKEEPPIPENNTNGARDNLTHRKEEAMAIIGLNISHSLLHLITDKSTPHECWSKLCGHFDRATLANKLFLKKKFFRFKMEESSTVQAHLRALKELTDSLAAVGVNIPEEDRIVTLLGSLPSKFDSIVTALEAHVDDLTLEFVEQSLLNQELKADGEEKLMKCHEPKNEHKKRIVCSYCNKPGHKMSQCWTKKKKEKAEKPTQTQAAAQSNPQDKSSKDSSRQVVDFSMKVAGSNGVTNELLVDCGATTHIVSEEKLFTSFDRNFNPKGHIMEMADGTRIPGIAKGRGDAIVNLIDQDGRMRKVRLKNALFVPGFQNIFAVKCAVDSGCEVTFTKDSAALTTEDGTTFPFFLHNRLYYLFTCLNDVDCVNKAGDLTKWHCIMGHANVRDIKQLPRSCT